ncbi:MAG: flagellar motor protein [Betaproteobacteria bacterium]|nr:flagellar motor protein [Betaproteobacteria bacterium]
MRFDLVSLIGILLGLSAVLLGQFMEGGSMASLLQSTAFVIVVGGTLGAVMLQSSMRVFLEALDMLKWVLIPPVIDNRRTLQRILDWSQLARRGGLLALEPLIDEQPDLFQRRGLQLLVDGAEPELLRETLEMDLNSFEQHHLNATRVWMSAGGYAPTIGILGAVMGLIHVMENLSDPSKLGAGIAVAFVATIYGVGSANLLFIPIANKLRYWVERQVANKELFIQGMVGIANGENPRMIEAKLQGCLA